MDKNTVIGMLLMCAVIFGFMFFQQPSEEEAQKQQQQAAKTEQAASQTTTQAVVDTLSTAEMTLLDTLTAKNGSIAFEGVTLNNVDG